METEALWQAIEQERRSLAALLATMSDEEWDQASLCDGWRVRDVAAHLCLAADPPGPWQMAKAAARAGGRFHVLNRDLSRQHADRVGAALAGELERLAGSRRLPPGTSPQNTLFDVLVHGQDIARPLGRPRPVPAEAGAAAAQRLWSMGWPFWARRRFRGLRLRATDSDWAAGEGPEVAGPVGAVLLLLTGRPAALPELAGPGVGEAARRLAGS